MIKKTFAILLVTIFIFSSMITSSSALTKMPYEMSHQAALNEIRNNQDLVDIYLIGDSNVVKSNLGFSFKEKRDLQNISPTKKYNSVWITGDKVNEYLSPEGVSEINALMDQGFSILFIGLDDINALRKAFTNQDAYEEDETPDNSYQPRIGYISKNKNGEVFIGHTISEKDPYHPRILERALSNTWNQKNYYEYTRKPQEEAFTDNLMNEAEANNGSDFTIGSDWDNVFSWTKYDWETDYGFYTEWKAGWYLTTPVDNNNYFALSFEGAMDPNCNVSSCNNAAASSLNYNSKGERYSGDHHELRTYAPKSSPSSSTYTFGIGGGYSSGSNGIISASWSVEVSDLNLTDNSTPSANEMDIIFQYDNSSTYAKNTSWQNASVIHSTDGITDVPLHNYRKATFLTVGTGIIYFDSAEHHYKTIVSGN